MNLMQGDCLELMEQIPDGSVDLVLTDPPYNIGVATQKGGKSSVNAWDKIDDYINWCVEWLTLCSRKLKPNGVLYFWHNDMEQIVELLTEIKKRTPLAFVSFCIWDKGDTYRARSWHQRDPKSRTALRSWFNVCEYCLHFFNAPADADKAWAHTGLDRVYSDPACFKPLKEWYLRECERLGLDNKKIGAYYEQVTGKKPHMLRHYFQDSQFEIPTQKVWESVYEPLGFGKGYESLRQEYESLRQEYESLRQEYESLRNYHRCDDMHCNIWHRLPLPTTNRLHTCQKPLDITERLIRVSCPPGGTVLDCFMGSGTTGVAALNTGRDFIGFEKDSGYFEIVRKRIEEAQQQIRFTG